MLGSICLSIITRIPVIQGTDLSNFLAKIKRENNFSVNYNLLIFFLALAYCLPLPSGTNGFVDERHDLGSHQFHVVHAVARWIRALVSGDCHSDLSPAETAPVLQLDLPKLADGWRFGKRRGQRPKNGEAHTKQNYGHRDGHEDLEDQHLSSLRATPLWTPVGA